jgi:hypothetical protein
MEAELAMTSVISVTLEARERPYTGGRAPARLSVSNRVKNIGHTSQKFVVIAFLS